MSDLACPNCKRSDSVQKVSSIVASGTGTVATETTSKSSYIGQSDSGGFGALGVTKNSHTSVHSTQLAAKLAEPTYDSYRYVLNSTYPDPNKSDYVKNEDGTENGSYKVIRTVAQFIWLGTIIAVCAGFIIHDLTLLLVGIASCIIVAFILNALLGVLRKGVVNSANGGEAAYKRNLQRYETAKREMQQQRHNKWNSIEENWRKLYYCHRCDGVFIPGSYFSEIEGMSSYISLLDR